MPNLTFKRRLVWTAWAALVALAMTLSLGAGTGVFAQTTHTTAPKEEKAQATGQQSTVDPKTGKVEQPDEGDTKALNEAMKKLFDRHPEGLKTTYFANGTVMVELTEADMDASVIKINPDGSTSVECVTGMKAAEESIKAQGAGAKANSAP